MSYSTDSRTYFLSIGSNGSYRLLYDLVERVSPADPQPFTFDEAQLAEIKKISEAMQGNYDECIIYTNIEKMHKKMYIKCYNHKKKINVKYMYPLSDEAFQNIPEAIFMNTLNKNSIEAWSGFVGKLYAGHPNSNSDKYELYNIIKNLEKAMGKSYKYKNI